MCSYSGFCTIGSTGTKPSVATHFMGFAPLCGAKNNGGLAPLCAAQHNGAKPIVFPKKIVYEKTYAYSLVWII